MHHCGQAFIAAHKASLSLKCVVYHCVKNMKQTKNRDFPITVVFYYTKTWLGKIGIESFIFRNIK